MTSNIKHRTSNIPKHSPLPWAIRVTRANAGAPKNVRICDHIGLTIAMIHGSSTAGVTVESVNDRKDANAEFIVRACNNAQRLADACKLALSALTDNGRWLPDEYQEAARSCDKALAQWEGQCLATQSLALTHKGDKQ